MSHLYAFVQQTTMSSLKMVQKGEHLSTQWQGWLVYQKKRHEGKGGGERNREGSLEGEVVLTRTSSLVWAAMIEGE